jgi:D-alanyl-D-alanine carboxypeptidase
MRTLLLGVVAAVLAAGCGGDNAVEPTPVATEVPSATATAEATPSATATVVSTSTTLPDREGTPLGGGIFEVVCGDVLAPVDKQHRLPAGCEPGDLVTLPAEVSSGGTQRMRADAAAAFQQLNAAARSDGFTILAASAYRSYATQVELYAGHVARNVQAGADRISARPGHSEHQMGTTTDVTSPTAGFGLDGFRGTPESAWLAENAHRFGFVVSYPEGKEHITGYVHEPWHIRWVGVDEAAKVRESGLTLHEWLLR